MKRAKGKSLKIADIVAVAVLIIGIFLLAAPLTVNMYFNFINRIEISKFNKVSQNMGGKEYSEYLRLSREYNKSMKKSDLRDPFSKRAGEKIDYEEKEGVGMYLKMLNYSELLCYVEIPKIDVELPVYVGTGEEVLNKGAGHLEGSSLPVDDKSTNCVIVAHRGIGHRKMLKDAGKIKCGDIFYIDNVAERIKYKVVGIYTVNPDEFSKLNVVEGREYCTLLTCTPYLMNTKRLLIRGERVGKISKEEHLEKLKKQKLKKIAIASAIALIILIIIFRIIRKKKRK